MYQMFLFSQLYPKERQLTISQGKKDQPEMARTENLLDNTEFVFGTLSWEEAADEKYRH